MAEDLGSPQRSRATGHEAGGGHAGHTPTDEDLARIADRYGFHLTGPDLRSFQALASGLLVSYDEVERLYEETRQAAPQRRYQWPAEGANDLGAWYVTTEITTREDGPLAGRRVAVKDNIAVAGVHARPPGADHPDRPRRGDDARGAGRPGRA